MACGGEKDVFNQISIIGSQKKKPFKEDIDDRSNSEEDSITSSDPETQVTRDQWNNKAEFLFSCISYSIGLGNLWRFPYKCYNCGGAAFLIPYLLFLFIAGMPLYFLELSMGQFSSQGPFGVWHISRVFVGIGYAMVMISFLCSIYYNVIVAWVVRYLLASLKALLTQEDLPWMPRECVETKNKTLAEEMGCANKTTDYWEKTVLARTSMEDFGGFQWDILGCFVISWVLVCLFLIKGVKGSGKVTYFTAMFPYVIIAVLLVRGLTLEGAGEGLKFYFLPKWEKLLEVEVWNTAATQIFYSLGLAFGSLTTLASYSPFKNNVLRMTLIVTVVNCSTSIIAGIVIFCVIGHLATVAGKAVEEVVASGPGLAFIVYPDAVSRMPGSAFWAFMFFFMMLNLGFGSQLALVETVITAVVDRVPKLLKYKWLVCIVSCLSMFVLGLPMVTRSGEHWLNLMDNYSCSYSLFVVSFIEIVALIYVYGVRRILIQIEAMLGRAVMGYYWWALTWCFTAPFSMLVIFILNMWFYKPMEIEGVPIPGYAEALGWLMAISSVIFIPAMAIVEFMKTKGTVKERLVSIFKPDALYRPHSLTDLKEVNELLEKANLEKLGGSEQTIYSVSSRDGVHIGKVAGDSLDTVA